MNFTYSKIVQRNNVIASWIAFVFRKAIVWVLSIELYHQAVAVYFYQNRSRADGGAIGSALGLW